MADALLADIEHILGLVFIGGVIWIFIWSIMRPSADTHDHHWGIENRGTQKCHRCGLIRKIDERADV